MFNPFVSFFPAHLYVEPSNIITVCKLCRGAVTHTEHERQNPVFLSSLTQKCSRKLLLSPASLNAKKNSPVAACTLWRWWRSQRGKYVSLRACLTRVEGLALMRATVGEQDSHKSICTNLRRAAAVMQRTAGTRFFNHLITLN